MVVHTLQQRWEILQHYFENFVKKKSDEFRWSSLWPWRVCKQAKFSHLVHRKADAPPTSNCLLRILVQSHNWAIILKKWARGRYSQWRSFAGHVERIFVHNNLRGGYWLHLVSTGRRYVPHSRSYTRYFARCFWRSHYQPQMSFGHLGAAI